MEGIETGGAELGAGLTDQDSQDSQGSDLEDVGDRVGSRVSGRVSSRVSSTVGSRGGGRGGGGIMIQGAGTGPRRTRSGKVVKYT